MSGQDAPWGCVPEWMAALALRGQEYRVLIALAARARVRGAPFEADTRQLAERAVMDEGHVRRALRGLVEAGAVERLGRTSWRLVQVPPEGWQATGGRPRVAGQGWPLNRPHVAFPVPKGLRETLEKTTQAATQPTPTANEQAVFDAWVATLPANGNRRQLTAERRTKIRARLRDYPLADVLDAVRGWQHDPWSERPQHNDLTILLRNGAQLERFRDLWRAGPPTSDLRRRTQAVLDEVYGPAAPPRTLAQLPPPPEEAR